MDATNPMTPENQQKRADSRRKRKAILAGGVVLGLGAAVTLAAWSDDVFANGTFNTGSFDIEGSNDGTNWDEYATAAAAAPLSFQVSASQMSPSETVYAPFSIRTVENTSLPGEVTLVSSTANGGFAGILTYEIFETSAHGANCNPTQAGALTPWAGTSNVQSVPSDIDPIAIGANMTTPAHLCIAVTLGDQAAVEGIATPSETTVTWEFNGLSTDAT